MRKLEYSNELCDYLLESMDDKERKAFEEKMEQDKELREQFEMQKAMLESIHARLIYEEVMADPHLAEADRMAKEIIEEMKMLKGNDKRTKK